MDDLLRTLRAHNGVTILHVIHNSAEAGRLADRVFLLRDGRVEQQ